LEAAASGLPVVCTAGGPTEDFVTDNFTRKIQSRRISALLDGQEIYGLEPNLDALTEVMIAVAQDSPWRHRAAEAAALHVRSNFTWDHAVDRLVLGLFG